MNTCKTCAYGVCRTEMTASEVERFERYHMRTMSNDEVSCHRHPVETAQSTDYWCGEFAEKRKPRETLSASSNHINTETLDKHLAAIDANPFSTVTCVTCGREVMKCGCTWKTDAHGNNPRGPFCSGRCAKEVVE